MRAGATRPMRFIRCAPRAFAWSHDPPLKPSTMPLAVLLKFPRRLAVIPAAAALLCLVSAARAATPATSQPSASASADLTSLGPCVRDLDGHAVYPFLMRPGERAMAVIFASVDCPISNGYAPLVGDLAKEYAGRGIDFLIVYADPSVTADAARTHHDAYRYPCPAVLDHDQQLTRAVSAAVTPTAVLVGPDGRVLYRGRIDDQFAAVGHKRYAATTHDFADALAAVAAGVPVTVSETKAVGCAIPHGG